MPQQPVLWGSPTEVSWGAGTGSRFFPPHMSEEDGVLEAPSAQLAGEVDKCGVGAASLETA